MNCAIANAANRSRALADELPQDIPDLAAQRCALIGHPIAERRVARARIRGRRRDEPEGDRPRTRNPSGAVTGVLGGYALLYPRARVLTLVLIIFFVTLIEVPAVLMLGIWFVLQFLPAGGVSDSALGSAVRID